MTGYVADLSWKSGARAIEKLDRLRSTLAVNVLIWGEFCRRANIIWFQQCNRILSKISSNPDVQTITTRQLIIESREIYKQGKEKLFPSYVVVKILKICQNNSTMKLELFSLDLEVKNPNRWKYNRCLTPTPFGVLILCF